MVSRLPHRETHREGTGVCEHRDRETKDVQLGKAYRVTRIFIHRLVVGDGHGMSWPVPLSCDVDDADVIQCR